ncbi:hypothetical protein MMC25_005627 [Agyrium rufum]|nr:hypothetical protein [Agyrium rufum]
MSQPSIRIEMATEADIWALASVHARGFSRDTTALLLFSSDAEHVTKLEGMFTNFLKNPKMTVLKAVDSTSTPETIAGAICFMTIDANQEAIKVSALKSATTNQPEPAAEEVKAEVEASPKSRTLMDCIRQGADDFQKKNLKGKEYIHYQKQGIGASLVRKCQAAAAEQDLVVYLQASPTAHKMYKSCGFTEQGQSKIDLQEWAGEEKGWGTYVFRHMTFTPVAS